MKKYFLICMTLILVLSTGCSLKIQRDVFYLPQEDVESVEIQREYFTEGEETSYFRSKKVADQKDMEKICEMIRKLPVIRASSSEPNPITEFSMIIILDGKKEHHLVLTDEMAFYDQIAYEYTKDDTYEMFVELYNSLEYDEVDTEPDRF
ncbi:MAG: hypothetical protein IJ043_06375 [Clostridia bacterium]|nr:hypothetical protein [Clostridia bacterium]